MPLSYDEFRKKFNEGQKNLEASQARAASGGYRTFPSSSNNLPPIPGVSGKYDVMRHTMMTSQPVPIPEPGNSDFIGPSEFIGPPTPVKPHDEGGVTHPNDNEFIGSPAPVKTTVESPNVLDKIVGGLASAGEWIDQHLPWVGKASDALWQADQAVSDFKAGALDTATLGATQGVGRAALDMMKQAAPDQAGKLDAAFKDRLDSTPYKVGEFAGYLVPGTAIDKAIVKVGGKALEKLAPVAQGLVRGSVAGALDSTAQEIGDVAFREGKFDPLNVAIGTGLGGALGAAIPAVAPYISKGIQKLTGKAGKEAETAMDALPVDKAVQPAVPHVDTPSLPNTVSRIPNETVTPAGTRGVSAPLTGTLDNVLPPRGMRTSATNAPRAVVPEQTPAVRPVESPVHVPTNNAAPGVHPLTGSPAPSHAVEVARLRQDLLAKKSYTTGDINDARTLIKHLQSPHGKTIEQMAIDNGDAATLIDTLSTQLTKSGQSIEAANVWNMLSPESYVIALEHNLARVNRLKFGDNTSKYVHMSYDQLQGAHKVAQLAESIGVHAQDARNVSHLVRSNMAHSPGAPEQIRKFLSNMNDLKNQGYLKGLKDPVVQRYSHAMDDLLSGGAIDDQTRNFLRSTSLKISRLGERERKFALQDMQAIKTGHDELEFKLGRKLSTMQYLGMLFNIPTQLRNIIGNSTLWAADRLARMIALPVDMLLTRTRWSSGSRQIYFHSGQGVADTFFDGLMAGTPFASKDWREGLALGARAGWKGLNPEGLTSKYEIGGFAFSGKSKYKAIEIGGKTMRFLEKTLGATMKGFDHAQYNMAYQRRLQEGAYAEAMAMAKAAGKENDATYIHNAMEGIMHNVDNHISQMSKKYGQFITLQDDSAFARALVNGRKMLNGGKEFGIGSIIMPFAKVPANLVMRAIDFSPIGAARDFIKLWKIKNQYAKAMGDTSGDLGGILDKQAFAQGQLAGAQWEASMSVGRAIVGVGIGYTAWHFAEKGLIWANTSSDQKTREFDQAQGKSSFQMNISGIFRAIDNIVNGRGGDAVPATNGDLLVAYDWLQPISFPVAMASTLYKQSQDPAMNKDLTARGINAGSAAFDTLFQSSPLRGLKDMFRTSYGEDSFSQQLVRNLATTGITQLVPAAARQLKQTMDNKVYETYDPSLQASILNKAKVNIPFMDTNLPESVTTMGTKLPREHNGLALVNPFRSADYSTDDNIKFLADLFNDTGDTGGLPNVASKTVSVNTPSGPQSVKLSAADWTRLQEQMGNEMIRRLGMINPSLPLDQKEFAVKNVISGVGTFARNTLIHDKIQQRDPNFYKDLNLKK